MEHQEAVSIARGYMGSRSTHIAGCICSTCEDRLADALQKAATDAARQCAEIADQYATKAHDTYKGRAPETEYMHRADSHTDGMSDGAGEVAAEIRAKFGIDAEAL